MGELVHMFLVSLVIWLEYVYMYIYVYMKQTHIDRDRCAMEGLK